AARLVALSFYPAEFDSERVTCRCHALWDIRRLYRHSPAEQPPGVVVCIRVTTAALLSTVSRGRTDGSAAERNSPARFRSAADSSIALMDDSSATSAVSILWRIRTISTIEWCNRQYTSSGKPLTAGTRTSSMRLRMEHTPSTLALVYARRVQQH